MISPCRPIEILLLSIDSWQNKFKNQSNIERTFLALGQFAHKIHK